MAAGIESGEKDKVTPRFVRAVGLLGLTAISLNGVIGSGIFVLPATVAAILGPASPLAYVIAALATTLIVACFAEAGSAFDKTGGPYLYARAAFGNFVGFQVGWVFLLTRLAAAAAITNAFVDYLGYFWPSLSAGPGRIATMTSLVLVLAWLNLVGVRSGSRTVNLLTVAKLIPLLLFISVGLFNIDPQAYNMSSLPDWNSLKQASLALIFAFGGFENASVPTEEVNNPRRSLPIALISSIAITTVIYMLIQIVAMGTLPGLANDPTPLATSSSIFLGPTGAALMTIGAILSTSGSNSALMLVGPRILYAFGVEGQLPSVLSRIHQRYRTPHIALVAFAAVTLMLALSGSFAELVMVSAMSRLLFSATTCLAVPVLRRRRPKGRAFTLRGGLLVPALAVAVSVWLLTGISGGQLAAGGVALLVGATLYLLFKKGDGRTKAGSSEPQ